jgi:hypothetical protein
MNYQIDPAELALLLVWLTAPAQLMMLLVLSLSSGIRRTFGKPSRFRSVLVLMVAYMSALVLTLPIWLLLPHAMLPPSVPPESWPSLPPFAFAPAWISCSTAGLGAWFVMRRWLPSVAS